MRLTMLLNPDSVYRSDTTYKYSYNKPLADYLTFRVDEQHGREVLIPVIEQQLAILSVNPLVDGSQNVLGQTQELVGPVVVNFAPQSLEHLNNRSREVYEVNPLQEA